MDRLVTLSLPGDSARRRLVAAAGFGWALLVLLNWPSGHPIPFDAFIRTIGAPLVSLSAAALPAAAGRAAAAGLFLLAVLAAAGWTGALVHRWAGRLRDPGDGAVLAPLLGLGGGGLAAFGAGMCGLLYPGFYAAAIALAVVPAVRRRRAAGRAVAALFQPFRIGPEAGVTPLAALGLSAAAVAAAAVQAGSLVSGLTPPHVSDELVMHLGLARWYLLHHSVVVQPGNVFCSFPHLDSLLYAAGEAAGIGGGVKWLHWAAGWLGLAAFARLVDGGGPVLGRLSIFSLASVPVLWTFAGRAFSDLFLVACGGAAVLAARRRRPVLAGLAVGLAGGFKLTGLLLALLVAPLLPLRGWLPAGIAAVVAVLPWLARNELDFGNPVHPFLWRVFGEPGWDAALDWRFRHEGWQGDVTPRWIADRIPALPWLLTVRNLGSGPDGSSGVIAALAFPLLLAGCRTREAAALVAFGIPAVLGAVGIRFLLPALPLAAAAAARGAARLPAGPRIRAAWLAAGVLLVGWQSAEFVPAAWRVFDDPLPVVLGEETRQAYLDRMRFPRVYYPFPSTWPGRAVASRTPPDARVLFIGGFGGAYAIPRWCVFTPLQGRPLPVAIARECRSVAAIERRFRQLGITDVVVNRWLGQVYLDYWRFWDWGPPANLERWKAFWDRHAVPMCAHGRHLGLFALSRRPRAGGHLLTPGFESEVVNLAVVLVNRRRQDEAAALMADVAPTFPRDPELWMALGMARAAQGRMSEARDCAGRVAALAPGSAAGLRVRAAVAAADGRLRDAASLLESSALRFRDDPYAWLDLSVLGWRLRDPGLIWRAETEYRRYREYGNVR